MNDLAYAARQLRKTPGFTAVAVLTLGLGIGACAAIFSVVNEVLVRPLPMAQPDRVVVLKETFLPRVPEFVVTSGKYLAWKQQATTLAGIGAWTGGAYILTGQGQPERLSALRMTASLLPTLGLQPMLGRSFTLDEEKPAGSENVAILSHGFWQRRFGGRPDVLGQVVSLSGRPFTIVGVLPRQTPLDPKVEILAPATFGERQGSFAGHFLRVFGRLQPGVSVEEARSELAVICERLATQHPAARGWGVRVDLMTTHAVGAVKPALLALLGAVGFLLLIACANVANLLLARAMSRAREVAVRAALGASRARIVRQLLIESVLLALLGGGVGVLVAAFGLELLLALAPDTLPRAREIAIDGRALGFTFALAVLTGIGFGLVPAFQATRVQLVETLKTGRGAGETVRRHRLRGALVVLEVGIALVLLTGAGLLARSFARLYQANPGFDAANAVAASVHLPRPKYLTTDQYATFARQAMEQMAALPGVQAVAAATNLPFNDINNSWGTRAFAVQGRPLSEASRPMSNYYSVSPDYFRAMGIPLLRGRAFEERDAGNAPRVAIISESVAKKFFPDEDPLGKGIGFSLTPGGPQQIWREIVGVVGDVKPRNLDDVVTLQTYEPFAQATDNDIIFVVRTAGPAPGLPAALRTALARVDPDQPFNAIHPMERLVGDSIARQRFAMTMFAVFSGVALLLAAIGIYGVMAYSVAERRSEIGIRMALGAQTGDVLQLVLAQGGRLIAGGLVLGVVGALLLTRFLETLLFGVGTRDPLTFVAIALLLAAVAGVACLVPARRAARVQPMVALRAE